MFRFVGGGRMDPEKRKGITSFVEAAGMPIDSPVDGSPRR
jgi:hypothetical protein